MTMDSPENDLENGLAALEHIEVYNERDLPCRTCNAGMRVYIYILNFLRYKEA